MSERARSVEQRLVSVGRSPVPAPRAAFADGLEDRLRAVGDLALEPSPPPAVRPRRSFVGLGVVGSAVAAIALVLAGGSTTPLQVRVVSATDTLMVLPDGTVDEVASGLIVPDGARLVTGDGGRMVAGDVELGPNREATVDRGTLRPSRLPVETVPHPLVTQPSPTTVTPGPSSRPEPRTAGDQGDAKQDPPVPPTGPSGSREPTKPTESNPDPAPARPDKLQPKPVAGESTASTSAPGQAPLRLRARRQDRAVRLDWSPYEGKGFAAYLVLRSEGGTEPRYPLDRRTTVVARLDDQHAGEYLDAIDRSDGHLYRVVAVDDQRRMLARTAAVAPVAEETQAGAAEERKVNR